MRVRMRMRMRDEGREVRRCEVFGHVVLNDDDDVGR